MNPDESCTDLCGPAVTDGCFLLRRSQGGNHTLRNDEAQVPRVQRDPPPCAVAVVSVSRSFPSAPRVVWNWVFLSGSRVKLEGAVRCAHPDRCLRLTVIRLAICLIIQISQNAFHVQLAVIRTADLLKSNAAKIHLHRDASRGFVSVSASRCSWTPDRPSSVPSPNTSWSATK